MSKGKNLFGYQVLTEIGRGAASILYSVYDPKTRHIWALKHVVRETDKDQRFLEQVELEYAVGSKLEHRNIRSIEKLIKHRKLFKVTDVALIMELLDAQTLDQRRPRTQEHAVGIFIQVARGLGHMHGRGFVHADIKPSNILITDDDTVKIIDLGQACPVGTVKKRIQGTPGYMAPEQAHRQSIDAKTDIYNLGATMYWVLVGEVIPTTLPPKDEKNTLVTGALDPEHVEPPVPPNKKNPTIHPLLSQQILDCVQLSPDKRPESMEVVANRLELILDVLEHKPAEDEPMIDDTDETTMF